MAVERLYRLAERFEIQEVLVEDNEAETKSSIGHAFKGILLLVLSDTKYYQQHDILKIYSLLGQFAKYADLETSFAENQRTASFYLEIDGNEPPKLVQNETAVENGSNYFLFTLLRSAQNPTNWGSKFHGHLGKARGSNRQ